MKSLKMKYYAVREGRVPGVYTSWATAREHVEFYRNCDHRSFQTRKDAEHYVRTGNACGAYQGPKITDYYLKTNERLGAFSSHGPGTGVAGPLAAFEPGPGSRGVEHASS